MTKTKKKINPCNKYHVKDVWRAIFRLPLNIALDLLAGIMFIIVSPLWNCGLEMKGEDTGSYDFYIDFMKDKRLRFKKK